MANPHREGDFRVCGATTIASQSFVKINGQPWAVIGDLCTHGAGGISGPCSSLVRINGFQAALLGDNAYPDSLCNIHNPVHCNPYTVSGEPTMEST